MRNKVEPSLSLFFLGIECGATRTVVLLSDGIAVLKRIETGAANLKLLSDAQLARQFRFLRSCFPRPAALGIGMAGARTTADLARIHRAAALVWPQVPCHASHDLETALAAADELETDDKCPATFKARRSVLHPNRKSQIANRKSPLARVLVLSGTGSCCYGRSLSGKTAKVGGWGHILGDKGSGYEIGLRALKAVVYYYDRDAVWPTLGQRLLRALQLNDPEALVGWVQTTSKADIAGLAVEVFHAWAKRDKIASDILEGAAHSLANDAVICAQRLVPRGAPVQFVLNGSVLLKQPRFIEKLSRQICELWPNAVVTPLARESVWGAVKLAKEKFKITEPLPPAYRDGDFDSRTNAAHIPGAAGFPPTPALSPTEQRNPRSMNLDKLSVADAIELMLSEDEKLPAAILAKSKQIEQTIGFIVRAFRSGGRLFYVGAGTSGRLGVLDASECPPTFRTPPEQVQGIIAGGQRALWESVEGAEDDGLAGAQAIEFRGVNQRDVVVGIAASGHTPFVWGALGEAKKRGAITILLCFNPSLNIPRAQKPNIVIAPTIGPEILTGSTRLKAGTATKLILNLFTTLAMVRLRKVAGNLMVDLNPANNKLRDRALRIVKELTGTDYPEAKAALEQSGWVVKAALRKLARRKPRRPTR